MLNAKVIENPQANSTQAQFVLRSEWACRAVLSRRSRFGDGGSRCGEGGCREDGKEDRKNRKNRKICPGPFSNCNLLPPNLFRPKVQTGILRIIRNFLRVGIWGEGGRKGSIMKPELRNRHRCPNGVLKASQLLFARLPNQTPSQSVAASRSDIGSKSTLAAAIEPFLASRIPLSV